MSRIQKLVILLAGLCPLFFNLSDGRAASKDIALVLKVRGDVRYRSREINWTSLKRGRRLTSGDRIRTGEEALVALVFSDDKSMMKIRSDSEVSIRGERKKRGITKRLFMGLGEMWAKVNPRGGGFRLETPSGVAAVRGTEFYGLVDTEGITTIIGVSGVVELFNELGSVLINEGETGQATKGQAPTVGESTNFPNWGGEDEEGSGEIELEFEDEDGFKKRLKIKYRKPEQ